MGTTAKTVNSAAISMIGSGGPLRHRGHETGSQPPIDRPMIYRARRMPRLENPLLGKDPRGIFHLHERGAGWTRTRTRTQTIPEISGWRTRPNFLAKFFGKKFWREGVTRRPVLTAPRSEWSFTVATPPATAPSLAQVYSAGRLARHASLACQPSISCSWRRSSL